MNDFSILLPNGNIAPPTIVVASSSHDRVVVRVVARDGAVGKGRLVTIDTGGALLPLSAVTGALDATGTFQFTVGPASGLSAFWKGNFSLDITVGGHTKSQGFKFI